MKRLLLSAFLVLAAFSISATLPAKTSAICNNGGCCTIEREINPGGRGVTETFVGCDSGYVGQRIPGATTADGCQCVAQGQVCQNNGKQCTSDTWCQSGNGCGSFTCFGLNRGGRTLPGTCRDTGTICSKSLSRCDTDSDCQTGDAGCSAYTCWTIQRHNGTDKQCRVGVQPTSTPTPSRPGFKPAPCNSGLGSGIETALGCIPTNTTDAFVAWVLRWAIGISGGIAFLLIILSGFRIMTASGDPEKMQGGRELLTAAISGLILIIFSVFLLELIGVQILQIPGF